MVLSGGYNVEVADAIPPRYECQICLLILRQPVQTLCGHRFCRICLNSLYDQQGGDIICPIDRKTVDMKTLFYDIAYEREILDISVKCSNHKSGCNWIGELRDLEDHIEIQCTRQKIQCQHENCSTMVFRRDLDGHIRNDCLYRTLNCNHCGDDYKYINEEYHESNCTRYPLPCNNNCGALQIPRDEIQEHLSKCPLTVVSCSFANVGCTIQYSGRLHIFLKNHKAQADSKKLRRIESCLERRWTTLWNCIWFKIYILKLKYSFWLCMILIGSIYYSEWSYL